MATHRRYSRLSDTSNSPSLSPSHSLPDLRIYADVTPRVSRTIDAVSAVAFRSASGSLGALVALQRRTSSRRVSLSGSGPSAG